MIASICSEPKVLEIMRIINIFISIIRIVVPILLIFSLIFKLISVIKSGNEDTFSKVKSSAIYNIVAAIAIFLLPNIINMIVKVSFPSNDYNNCLSVKTMDDINTAYTKKAETLISRVEQSLNINDYNNAMLYLKNIKDEDKKKSYEERLDIVIDKINIKEAERLIKIAEETLSETDLYEASKFIKNINNEEEAKKLNEKITKIDNKIQEKIILAEAKNSTGSLPGGDNVQIPPGQRPITDYVDINLVNNKIASAVKSKGLYTREAVVAAAETLIETLNANNYYIPYQLGGMYHRGNLWGVNPAWGTLIEHNGKQVLSGLDCRNFVHWTFKQAGLSLIRGFGYEGSLKNDNDNRVSISAGRPGDVIDANPHIMLIVQNTGHSYKVAESNGVGRVRLWEFTYNDLSRAGYIVYNMDAVYNNTGKYCNLESGYRAYSGSCHIPNNVFPSYY